MLTSQRLQNLRFGPVARAGMVKEGTVHAWRARNRLKLGRDVDGGNRRYDLADAARLTLMRFLTERLQMSAQAAATTVNAAGWHIELLAARELYRVDYPKVPSRAEAVGPFVMLLDRIDGSHPPEILAEHHLGQIDRERILEVKVRLNELVEYARDNLVDAIGESSFDLRQRLREAYGDAAEAVA